MLSVTNIDFSEKAKVINNTKNKILDLIIIELNNIKFGILRTLN